MTTQPIPTLERLALTLAVGSIGVTGCRNPFQPRQREARPIAEPAAVSPPALAALFASGTTTGTDVHRDPWMHVAVPSRSAVAEHVVTPGTPIAASRKDEPFSYAMVGGAMASVSYVPRCGYRSFRRP